MSSALICSCLVGSLASADSSGSSTATMYTKLTRTSSVWAGTKAYVFGGHGIPYPGLTYCCHGVDYIYQIDPVTKAVTAMNSKLPWARSYTSAVWTGQEAYIFGGRWDAPTYSNEVLRFGPSSDTITYAGPSLFVPTAGSSAVWTGSKAYIFGGMSRYPSGFAGPQNFIQKFDPAAGTVTLTTGGLNRTRYGSSAAWDGRYAYIIGGWDGSDQLVCDIERFDPVTEQATLTGASLCLGDSAAVWDGYNVFVFGGETGYHTYSPSVFRYSPASNSVTTMSANVGGARRAGMSAVWADNRALMFGGSSCATSTCTYYDNVASYNVQPNIPTGLKAEAKTSGGVQLTWNPTPSNSYSAPLQGYRLARTSYGLGGSGSSKTFVVDPSTTSYSDTGCTAGTICFYKVQAFNAQGTSAYSGEQVFAPGI